MSMREERRGEDRESERVWREKKKREKSHEGERESAFLTLLLTPSSLPCVCLSSITAHRSLRSAYTT